MKFYVVHSGDGLPIGGDSVLHPIHSPFQNYSELYVQKNVMNEEGNGEEYIAFFHMRRYLDVSVPISDTICKAQKMCPYHFQKSPNEADFNEAKLSVKLSNFDIIAPVPERTFLPVRERYAQFPYLRKQDLDCVLSILKQKHPTYQSAMESYLSGGWEYYGNMYIMKRKIFQAYAHWLFDLLDAFDEAVTDQSPRTPGYLSERLFGIWLTYQQETGALNIGWLPRVHFYGYDDATHHFRRESVVNGFLPAGSRRRFVVRKLLRKGR